MLRLSHVIIKRWLQRIPAVWSTYGIYFVTIRIEYIIKSENMNAPQPCHLNFYLIPVNPLPDTQSVC